MSNSIMHGEHLEITVFCCYNLRDTSRGIHGQDPYVRLEYANSSYRTQVCKTQAKDPVFGQKFEFPFLEGHHQIGVAVWNKNTMESDYLIGTARVLIDIDLLGGSEFSDDSVWPLQFEDRPAGQIRLIMNYQKRHTMGDMLRLSADFGHLQPVPYRIYAPTNYVPTSMYPIIPPLLPLPPDPVVIPSPTSRSNAYSPSAPSARSLTYNSSSLSAPIVHLSYGTTSPDLLRRPASLNSSAYVAPSEPSLYSPPDPELHSPPASLNPSSCVASSEPYSYIPPSTESLNRPMASLNSSSCVASSEPSSNSLLTPELLNQLAPVNSSTYVASSEPKSYSPPGPELMRQLESLNSSPFVASSEPSSYSPPANELPRQPASLISSAYVDPSEPLSSPPSSELLNRSRSLDSSSNAAPTKPSSYVPPFELLNQPMSLNSSSYIATTEPSKNPPSPHFRSRAVPLNSSSNVAATYQDSGDGSKEVQIWDSSSKRSKPPVRKRGRPSRSSYHQQDVHKEKDVKDINRKSEAMPPLVSNVSSSGMVPNLSVGRKVLLFVACFFFWVLIYSKVGYRFKRFALFR